MQQPMLLLISEGSSERALGKYVSVTVHEGSCGSWCSENVLICIGMIAVFLEIRMQETIPNFDLK